MTPLRNKEEMHAELAGLRQVAEITPKDDPIAYGLISSRIEELEEEINSLEGVGRSKPEAELFFSGYPVVGSIGIEAKFTSRMLDSYQDMVMNNFAANHGLLRRTGRRRGESESRLFLTALPHGSVGLQLSQPYINDFFTAELVAQSIEDISRLIHDTGGTDEQFETALSEFHPRVLKPLQRFFDGMSTALAECRIVTPRHDVNLNAEQVALGALRITAISMDEEVIERTGQFGGVLLNSRRFEMTPFNESAIHGWLADDIDADTAAHMGNFTGGNVLVTMRLTRIKTASGVRKPSYELLEVHPHGSAATIEGYSERVSYAIETGLVNVNEPEEIAYWAHRFNVTEDRIRQAVDKVGPALTDVERELAE